MLQILQICGVRHLDGHLLSRARVRRRVEAGVLVRVAHADRARALGREVVEVDVEDESIAEFEQDTPGEFGGHLHGVAVGETDVVFKLMHGAVGSGHADFVTAAVHAHVEDH